MGSEPRRLDLHLHTRLSDGTHSPEEVLRRCAEGRLDVVALTDHDMAPTLPSGRRTYGDRRLRLVHGVELSTWHRDGEQHLLVWFAGEMPEEFRRFCHDRARRRAERYEQARDRIGLADVRPADEDAWAGRRSLTRRHLAAELVRAGHARNHREAMRRWVGPAQGFVPPIRLPLLEAIGMARDCGGLTSWAHPEPERCRAWLGGLVAAGLQGIEGIRPGHGRRTRQRFRKLAARHHILCTGGSDSHGQPGRVLGHFAVAGEAAVPLLRALEG